MSHWKKLNPSGDIDPIRFHTSIVYNDYIYIFGGRKQYSLSNTLYQYNIICNIWKKISTKGNIPRPILGHASCLLDDKMYVFGGLNEEDLVIDDLYCLNFETFEWKLIECKSKPERRYFCSIITRNGNLYIYGGFHGLYLNDFWQFIPINNDWIKLNSENVPPKCKHQCILYDDKMFLFGGRNENDRSNEFYYFDFRTSKWHILNNSIITQKGIPSPRSGHSISLFRNKLYVFGGYDGIQDYNDFTSFDLLSQQWNSIKCKGDVPSIRSYHTTVIHNRKLYLFGGDHDEKRLNDLYVFEWEIDFSDKLYFNLKRKKFCDISIK